MYTPKRVGEKPLLFSYGGPPGIMLYAHHLIEV